MIKAQTPTDFNLEKYFKRLQKYSPLPLKSTGYVKEITGLLIRAKLPQAKIGEVCRIQPNKRPEVKAQVVGFVDDDVFLTALDSLDQVGPRTPVVAWGEFLAIGVGNDLLGRVVDSFVEPLDGLGKINFEKRYQIKNPAPNAMERPRITKALSLGIRAVDTLFTVGEGQRIGVFSPAGVGKSSLLGMIARNSQADVNVIALVGERGREVKDFIEESLGQEGLKRSVVVVSTSNESPMRRVIAAYTATVIAEYFRNQGKKVMLLMDSVTRFARSLREIALSLGEPPARQGFPPSVFAALPELIERAGNTKLGSITAFYTVLLNSEVIEDPLGEEIRAVLDGHIYLSSKLSKAQHYPSIDILTSNSRLMNKIVSEEHLKVSEKIKRLWSTYEDNRDLILLGAYKSGVDKELDEAISKREILNRFLIQNIEEKSDLESSVLEAKRLGFGNKTNPQNSP